MLSTDFWIFYIDFFMRFFLYSFSARLLHTTLCDSHLPLLKRMVKNTALTVQSVNIPIQTAIGPNPITLHRNVQRLTRNIHMESVLMIMENFTSPAARIPYPGIKDAVHTIGLIIVIQPIMNRHISALSFVIPASMVMGRASR